jgi:cysteinyl-tRNA synthetase
MPLRLFNTLTRRVEDFIPADPGGARITFYSCGPTVYDDAHIGNFRSFLAADVLRRWIESPLCELADGRGGVHRGPRRVAHVMNITDVGHMTDDAEGGEHGEDRMAVAGRRIAEAKKSGKLPADVQVNPGDPYQIARFYEDRFKDDARRLGLKLVLDHDAGADNMPRATDNIDGMKRMIARLIERGHAYVAGAPGARVVYFRVLSFAPYGRLSGNTLDKLKEGEGGRISAENQSQKEHPADFLLWKEDPRHIMKWDSPWGSGYPGWHIECSVMSAVNLLGEAAFESMLARDGITGPIIDLHSGGEDNIFPHHECEIAQTCACFMAPPKLSDPAAATYARLWFHPRFLLVEGTKMSKSKGNFFTARDLFARGIEPAALRLELIKTHYRSNANFTFQGLADSQKTIERWRRARVDIARRSWAWTNTDPRRFLDNMHAEIARALNDDLNIAAAIGLVNEMIPLALERSFDADRLPPWDEAETLRQIASGAETIGRPVDLFEFVEPILGVLSLERPKESQTSLGVFMDGLTPDPAVIAKLEDRRAARAAKDFARSDQIRDELLAMGYAIKDVPGGKVEVRRR